MKNVIIRKANSEDYKAIAEISRNDLGYESCTDELVKNNLSLVDFSRECVFVAENNGEVIGFVHIEKYNALYFESIANIMGLAVRDEKRRLGAGTALMNAAEEFARENGIAYIRLNSGFSRVQAHEFYRKIGYDSEKEQIRFKKKL